VSGAFQILYDLAKDNLFVFVPWAGADLFPRDQRDEVAAEILRDGRWRQTEAERAAVEWLQQGMPDSAPTRQFN